MENDDVLRLKHHIEQKRPDRGMEDGVYWKHSGSLYYPVKSINAKMYKSYAPTLPKPIINLVWQKFIPLRAQLSVWLANLGKLKLVTFLWKKGLLTPSRPLAHYATWKENQILIFFLHADSFGDRGWKYWNGGASLGSSTIGVVISAFSGLV